jgi:NAD+ synthase (glutamine-hydrolysing)
VPRLRLALAQLNLVVGDLDGNVERIVAATRAADAEGADVVAFPELAVSAYPPEDLLLKPSFVADNRAALDRVVAATAALRPVAVVGFTHRVEGVLVNAVAVCADGAIHGIYAKRRLPNYEVFDEGRYFEPGTEPLQLYRVAGVALGVSICEDAWRPGGPIAEQAAGGAQLIINANASPYHAGKPAAREVMLAERAVEAGCAIAYVNLVGGQDELVFDGTSMLVDPEGNVLTRAPQYDETLWVTEVHVPDDAPEITLPVVDLTRSLRTDGVASGTDDDVETRPGAPSAMTEPAPLVPLLGPEDEIYEALVVGTRDYCIKNGFTDVVLGLSGGIDSSLVAAVAVDALGAAHVHGVLMPSRYSSGHSITDAEALARNLEIDATTIVIEPAHHALLELLQPHFGERPADITEENLQPRIRGIVLMALSNKLGWLVLTTGNKSEMAVGYATLYGDMAGGYAVIKDVLKTTVYQLCEHRNARAGRELIPRSVITKAPSAELRPDQFDTDSLPPYEVLDAILDGYIERDRTVGDLIEEGFDEALVRRIARLVDLSEYKRRQAPPGPRVTTKAFGKDRRLPITNAYRG